MSDHHRATMFDFYEVSDKVQAKQQTRDFVDFIKILYHDPAPILKDYTPEPWFIPGRYRDYAQTIKDLKVHNDDVWIISHPKTGSTFLAELVCVLLARADFDKHEELPLVERGVYLEWVFH